MSRLHFIYFYTEGQNGDSLESLQQSAIFFDKHREYFDTIQGYTPHKLKASSNHWKKTLEDQTFWVQNHPKFSEDLNWNKSWAQLNFMAFKPLLILENLTSELISEGDIVFYHDINIDKYPEYKMQIKKWKTFILSQIKDYDVIVFNDNDIDFRRDTKQEVIDFFNINHVTGHHLWSGAIAIKKTKAGVNFCKEWSSATLNRDLVSPFTETKFKDFYWNSPDQATLTSLFYSQKVDDLKVKIKCINLNNVRIIPPIQSIYLGKFLAHFFRKYATFKKKLM